MMDNMIAFLTVMSTLSAATQALVDLIKKRWKWLNTDTSATNDANEQKRLAVIHLMAGIGGALLTWVSTFRPLTYLNPDATSTVLNVIGAGFLVSFGGGFFNDLLGVFKQLKGAQKALKEERLARAEAIRNGRVPVV